MQLFICPIVPINSYRLFFLSFFRSDWVPGLPSSPEHDWRTTDWKSKRWNSFQKSILTMVTSTLIMLILHLQDLIINANIVNIEKSNKANNEPRRERESNNNKEMLLWILSLFYAPSLVKAKSTTRRDDRFKLLTAYFALLLVKTRQMWTNFNPTNQLIISCVYIT